MDIRKVDKSYNVSTLFNINVLDYIREECGSDLSWFTDLGLIQSYRNDFFQPRYTTFDCILVFRLDVLFDTEVGEKRQLLFDFLTKHRSCIRFYMTNVNQIAFRFLLPLNWERDYFKIYKGLYSHVSEENRKRYFTGVIAGQIIDQSEVMRTAWNELEEELNIRLLHSDEVWTVPTLQRELLA